MRNDSSLYTGATSKSMASPREKAIRESRADKQKARQESRLKLLPAGEIVSDEFKREVHQLIHGAYEDEDKMSDAQFRAERRARRLAVQSLLAIQNRLTILLRPPEEKTKP